MKKLVKGTLLSMTAVMIFMILPGCTPGKAQTRGNDYKGSFETEEFEAFDRSGGTNDDEIPAYKEGKKVSSGRESSGGKDYDNSISRIKQDYDRDNNSAEGYNDGRKNSYKNTASAGYGEDYKSGDEAGYAENSSDRFYQKGAASWYGREFHGRATASGEKFDMNSMTAAHKTLPFGTIVEVKNLENGKSVRLKINDRGPYRGNRILDVSFGAAKELDMVKAGEASVGINVLKMGSRTSAVENDTYSKYVEPVSDEEPSGRRVKSDSYGDTADSGDMKLQAGAFYSRKNAEHLKSRIEGVTDKPVTIVQDGDFFKVRVEGMKSKSEMNRVKDSLNSESISSFSVE